ncbi:MAG TPA: rhomboid family intramembrane serine protease [Actinomycetota bacterium]|nr:rhomboid family intramembrane serine protease [Actinomycetota bacterium]
MLPVTGLIPIHDANPTRTRSILTIALIIVNVAIFFVEPQLGSGSSCQLGVFLFHWGVVPKELVSGKALSGNICAGFPLQDKSIYLSLITSMFLHAGWLHLAGNMLFLWVFGNNVEDRLGKIRFGIFYLACGIAAGLAHTFVNPESVTPTIGASGAIAGLLGAYIVLFPKARVTTIIPLGFLFIRDLPAYLVLGFWFLSQFFIARGQQAGGGVAWMAHVGGFVAGIALIVLLGGLKSRSTLSDGPPDPIWS